MQPMKELELCASFDFGNVVSSCVIFQKSSVGEQLRVRVLDEIWLRDSNTWECVEELVKRYGNQGYRLTVYGDATGQAMRGSAATQTDYDVIRRTCTGRATVNECARVLVAAGALSVRVACCARA